MTTRVSRCVLGGVLTVALASMGMPAMAASAEENNLEGEQTVEEASLGDDQMPDELEDEFVLDGEFDDELDDGWADEDLNLGEPGDGAWSDGEIDESEDEAWDDEEYEGEVPGDDWVTETSYSGIEDGGLLTGAASASVKRGGVTYGFSSYGRGKSVVAACKVQKNKKTVTIAKTVKIKGKTYPVSGMSRKLFKGTKVTTVKVKSTTLAKGAVKKCFKGSKVKTVKVPQAKKAAYKKLFKKANSGKKVTVK